MTRKTPQKSPTTKDEGRAETSPGSDSSKSPGTLFVVATPIGNMGDISLRAIETLKSVDAVICEDSRVSGGLLNRLGFKKPLVPYHDHNADQMRPRLLERLAAGEKLALISDAGTPLVSDPGCKLVREAVAAGMDVTALPGPSALLTALVLSGLPSDRFLFAGFLPSKQGQRRQVIAELASVPATLIFYESPHRLAESLADLSAGLGDRCAAVARELTKLFEEVRRGSLSDLARDYNQQPEPKGEIVLVIGPPQELHNDLNRLETLLRTALETMSIRDAAESVARATGLSRREVYNRALEMGQKK